MDSPLTSSVILQNVDVETLRESIVAEVVKAIAPMITAGKEPRLVDKRRMAELLSISEPKLERMVKAGEIPSKKIGSRRLFDAQAVVDSL